MQSNTFDGLKVLIIEDDPLVQFLFESMLLTLGINVDIFDDGQQGLEFYLATMKSGVTSIDLILMDCEMPVMDGYTATTKIREYEASQESSVVIPIVGLSGHLTEESKKMALKAGMTLYLTKPVKLDDLTAAIEKMCVSE